MLVFVHGDNFVSTADGDDLLWFKGVLEQKFELKSKIVGHQAEDEKSVKVLNRVITAVAQPEASWCQVVPNREAC